MKRKPLCVYIWLGSIPSSLRSTIELDIIKIKLVWSLLLLFLEAMMVEAHFVFSPFFMVKKYRAQKFPIKQLWKTHSIYQGKESAKIS